MKILFSIAELKYLPHLHKIKKAPLGGLGSCKPLSMKTAEKKRSKNSFKDPLTTGDLFMLVFFS